MCAISEVYNLLGPAHGGKHNLLHASSGDYRVTRQNSP